MINDNIILLWLTYLLQKQCDLVHNLENDHVVFLHLLMNLWGVWFSLLKFNLFIPDVECQLRVLNIV
jgi:hypothetical protein